MKASLLIAVLLLLEVTRLAAQEPAEEASASASLRSLSTEGAAVSFGALEDGDSVPPTFTVIFLISGMGIAPAGSNIDNTGHHHLLIGLTELPDMDQPLPQSQQIRDFGKGQNEVELTLPVGSHSLQLLFADYAHRPHDPPVISDKITITVAADAVQTREDS